MKRLSVLFLALLLLVTAIIPATAALPFSSASPTFGDQIAIVENGTAKFRIVRKTAGSSEAMQAARDIRDAIKDATGITLTIASDWVQDGASVDHNTYEILIGDTNYSESDEALEGASYGAYVITFVGNKLVINSKRTSGIAEAVKELITLIKKNGKSGKLTLSANLHIESKLDLQSTKVGTLPTYENGDRYAVMDAGDDTELLVINNTDPEEFAAYRKALESTGYQLYTENTIRDNLFATYTNKKYTVTVGYYAYESSARITIEPLGELPTLETDNQYEKVLPAPTIAQFGLETDANHKNGMSYVFQLSDGSYIVIDGGFNRTRDAQKLYDYMYKHAPDRRNITVAAWILTHGHSDHHGAFINFANTYQNEARLVVEQFIGAFVTSEYGGSTGIHNGISLRDQMAGFSGAEYIRAHVGQKYSIRDAEVEILYTTESFMPRELRNSNTTSLVFTVDIADQRFLFLGDATNEAMEIVSRMYGRYLKSDFVQTAHHGYTTGDGGMIGLMKSYAYAAPSVVLWPVAFADYTWLSRNYLYNSYLEGVLGSVKEIIVAGNRDVVLKLPYTAGTSGYDTILK